MKIIDMLSRGSILADMHSQTKREVLLELTQVFPGGFLPGGYEETVNILLEREKLGSTGIGEGIAIPHGKIIGLDAMVVSFGRSLKGIDFNAMDGRPVNLFFLLLAPEGSAGLHLKALAKISRMLKDAAFRRRLIEAADVQEMYSIIAEKDQDI